MPNGDSLEAMELVKQTIRDNSIGKVIDEIGTGPVCFTQNNLNDLRAAMLTGGWTAAQAKAAQFVGTDGYTDLLRIMGIMQKHRLSEEAAADILQNLPQIRVGHY